MGLSFAWVTIITKLVQVISLRFSQPLTVIPLPPLPFLLRATAVADYATFC